MADMMPLIIFFFFSSLLDIAAIRHISITPSFRFSDKFSAIAFIIFRD